MRQSTLKKILKSELHYFHELKFENYDSDALRIGRGFHALTFLSPAEADKKISTMVPRHRKGKLAGNEYKSGSQKFDRSQKRLRRIDVDLITANEHAHLLPMSSRARESFLDAGFDFNKCVKELKLIHGDYTGTLDLLQSFGTHCIVGDLKSCRSIEYIAHDVNKYHYDFQAAWYIDKLLVPLGYNPVGFHAFFIEKTPPYDAANIYLDESWLAVGRLKIRVAEAKLKRALTMRENKERFKISTYDNGAPGWLLDKWSELAQSYEEAPF